MAVDPSLTALRRLLSVALAARASRAGGSTAVHAIAEGSTLSKLASHAKPTPSPEGHRRARRARRRSLRRTDFGAGPVSSRQAGRARPTAAGRRLVVSRGGNSREAPPAAPRGSRGTRKIRAHPGQARGLGLRRPRCHERERGLGVNAQARDQRADIISSHTPSRRSGGTLVLGHSVALLRRVGYARR